MPSKQTLIGGGAVLALLAGGSGLDPAALIKATESLTWPQVTLLIAVAIVAFLFDSPATKAKIRDLTGRASLPPGKP
jgi:hypothetical protein